MIDAGITSLRRAGAGMLGLWGFALLAGFLPGLPIALLVGGIVGDLPLGELSLGAPGGLMLTEVLRLSVRDLGAAFRSAPVWVVLVVSSSIVPQAALAAQLASRGALSWADAVSLGVRRLSSLLALAAAHLFARVVLLGIVIFFATMSTVVAKTRPGELAVAACVAVVGLLLAGALRHLADIALVRLLVEGVGAGSALLDAFGTSGGAARAVGSLLVASLVGGFSFAVAVAAAHEIGAATTAQAMVSGSLRALAVLSLVVTRALWLGIAAGRAR